MLVKTNSLCVLSITVFLTIGHLTAQSLERYVVSPYGDCQTIGLVQYLLTAGEPITGVSQSSSPALTMGFEQPIRRYVLAPTTVWLAGVRTTKEIRLNWHTTHAEAGGQFVLLKHVSADTWQALERLPLTAGQLSYTYLQVIPDSIDQPSTQVFQIAQISRDGQLSKSNVLALGPLDAVKGDMTLYPNPANAFIVLETQAELTGTVSILDAAGQEIERFELPGGQHSVRLDLAHYPTGMYLMVLEQNGVRQSAPFQVLK